MRISNYAQHTVEQVAEEIPESHRVLHTNAINPTLRVSLANIAAATSVTTAELMAVIEYRMRRTAQQQYAEQEAELVA